MWSTPNVVIWKAFAVLNCVCVSLAAANGYGQPVDKSSDAQRTAALKVLSSSLHCFPVVTRGWQWYSLYMPPIWCISPASASPKSLFLSSLRRSSNQLPIRGLFGLSLELSQPGQSALNLQRHSNVMFHGHGTIFLGSVLRGYDVMIWSSYSILTFLGRVVVLFWNIKHNYRDRPYCTSDDDFCAPANVDEE